MALSNYERVGKAMEALKVGLAPFVSREFISHFKGQTGHEVQRILGISVDAKKPFHDLDIAALLRVMWDSWNEVYRETLGHAERSLVSELRDVRNSWAHQETFSSDDTYRALDSSHRLLTSVSSPQANDIDKMKMELLRVRFDEQTRTEKRRTAGTAIESQGTANLKPWREVITPHTDVATGRYQQAEFAADLWQVHMGEGSDEYRDPVEFFRRTYLTESLKRLLVTGAQRLSGKGGDPVVQLQTNFGGGKTHSMLALYHIFSGVTPGELAGVDTLLAEAGLTELQKANRVVLVGNRISPGNPDIKPDGTAVRTLWGEMAWQLGLQAGGEKEAAKAFARIAADDAHATSPGDALRKLLQDYGPCLVLIDEWVAYARQLHDQMDLPAGTFETQFTFAQALTESVKMAKNCLLVVSLPASDTSASPHAQADDAEVGGVRGREALDRLRNVIGRLESSWRPASAEEGFEIVRRRLFEPLTSPQQFKDRDVVAREFHDLYRSQQEEFPSECRTADYERRIKAAYPIHPEVFDRLYTDWSTLVKFQRTRGVLRLMAAVIHSLWEKGDKNPLILPSMVPIDDSRVQFELTRYLSDIWVPVLERDVDGSNSLPLRLDGEIPNLGKLHACRRVARTIYMGSAPTAGAAHRGVEDRRIKLGCVMPGETPGIFGDALRRLASTSTYLYQDGPRFWYSTQPTVTKLAEDRADELARDPDKLLMELDKRLRADLRHTGDFARIHALPRSDADIPDDLDARLVVLSIEHPYSKESAGTLESPAKIEARKILESRGNAPRLFRNTLVFLAVDKARLQDLDEAVRRYLAWESIVAEKDILNLDPHQARQAETQRQSADSVVTARIPEAYQWLLVPVQAKPQDPPDWQAIRLTGADSLAVRASRKLRNDELLITSFAATRLRMELDRVPLWRGDHVAVQQLVEDFAKYLYLPRLVELSVLVEAARQGVGLLTWEHEAFAFADAFDEELGRYRGLRAGQQVPLSGTDSSGVLVKPEVARRQMTEDAAKAQAAAAGAGAGAGAGGEAGTVGGGVLPDGAGSGGGTLGSGLGAGSSDGAAGGSSLPTPPPPAPKPRRWYGNVELTNPMRLGSDAGKIAEEVISHLAALPGAKVKVTLDIEASLPEGVPDHVVRIVTENGRTLKFGEMGFEVE